MNDDQTIKDKEDAKKLNSDKLNHLDSLPSNMINVKASEEISIDVVEQFLKEEGISKPEEDQKLNDEDDRVIQELLEK